MAELHDTVREVLADLDGSETYDEVEYAVRDFSAKEIAVTNAMNASSQGGAWPVEAIIYAAFPAKAHSNYGTVSTTFDDTEGHTLGVSPFGVRTSSDTNGAWVEWYVALRAGTWALTFRGWDHSNGGILVFSLNGTDIDDSPYDASSASYDTRSMVPPFGTDSDLAPAQTVCTDLVIPESGLYTLRATVTGKNELSGGYTSNINYIALRMVAL